MDRYFAFLIETLIQRLRVFPKEALNDLFRSLDLIEKKYNVIEPLTVDEKLAIQEGRESISRGEGVPMEEVFKRFGLDTVDTDTLGKEDFSRVILHVQRLPGAAQGDVAGVIYALLHQYRFDELPPTEVKK